jgi:hypothetical protein
VRCREQSMAVGRQHSAEHGTARMMVAYREIRRA